MINKIKIYGILMLAGLASCSPDDVSKVNFDVTCNTASEVQTVKSGEDVVFHFKGEADYITFYSGETGNNYDNRNRTESDIEGLKLKATFKQQSTDKEYRGMPIIHVYLSTDFNGKYTDNDINAATWKPISGEEYNQIRVPLTVKSSTEEVGSTIDMAEYKDKKFYVAMQYYAPKRKDVPTEDGGGRYVAAPRVDLTNFTLTSTTTDGKMTEYANMLQSWGFYFTDNSEPKEYFVVSDNSVLFQPNDKQGTKDISKWIVSRCINPRDVNPDEGVAIQTAETEIHDYTYSYKQPGEYTATFVARNANMWNCKEVVRQIKIKVTE